ncbi:LemA family protein [Bifidobacterium sp. 82T24]|uniref:LemA family protein n=1 Tax=Bifidobacterium pluvialisilvae TaxID=2834436 RepID=UPI001C578F51|nr:LemA family protein [Bifidobacterium pluvialisilvae]MBW3088772.1 LemA family protein [Bifidobacterium pluvialisilvae]
MIIGIIIAVIVVVLVVWAIAAYNGLVTLRNRVDNGWAQIDVQLKQRADLIPNLVETVKGYASHESQTLQAVTNARARAAAATTTGERAAAETQVGQALMNLMATAEAYPQLQANQNFLDLQAQLKALEDKIAYARQFYNDVVLKYNTGIQTVPNNIIAGMFHFTPREFFAVEESARAVPQVRF